MDSIGITSILVFAAMCAAIGGVMTFVGLRRLRAPKAFDQPERPLDVTRIYRFRDEYLISPIDEDDPLIHPTADRSLAFLSIRHELGQICPHFERDLERLLSLGHPFLTEGKMGNQSITVAGRLGELKEVLLTLSPQDQKRSRVTIDERSLTSLREELDQLRQTLDHCPTPVWCADDANRVMWANAAYLDLARSALRTATLTWPLPQLFAPPESDREVNARGARFKVMLADAPEYFDVSSHTRSDGMVQYAALPVSDFVEAETGRQRLLQKLAQTFATVPVGLAEFNNAQRLITFNPALSMMTGLHETYLASRPSLENFLTQLETAQAGMSREARASFAKVRTMKDAPPEETVYTSLTLDGGKKFNLSVGPLAEGGLSFVIDTPDAAGTPEEAGSDAREDHTIIDMPELQQNAKIA